MAITPEAVADGHKYVMGNINSYCPRCSDIATAKEGRKITALDCDFDLDDEPIIESGNRSVPTYAVLIIGPNLFDQSRNGAFHVHAAGCADVERAAIYRDRDDISKNNVLTMRSQVECAEYIYADMIDEGSMTAEDGVDDLYFFPCIEAMPYLTPDAP